MPPQIGVFKPFSECVTTSSQAHGLSQVPVKKFVLQVFKHVLNPKQPPDNPQSPFSIVTALVDRIRVQSSILPDQVRVTSEKPEPLLHYVFISRAAVVAQWLSTHLVTGRSWVWFLPGAGIFSSSNVSSSRCCTTIFPLLNSCATLGKTSLISTVGDLKFFNALCIQLKY